MSTRYDRLLSLSSFSEKDLKTLRCKRLLIIGTGGVGHHVATYLVTNGVEHIAIVDYDKVEISNLNRQILLTEDDVGKYKVDVVKEALIKRNSDAKIKSINEKLDKSNVSKIITSEYDVVVDALDNWEGKFLISDECNKKLIPFLHIGVDGMNGQYCLFKEKSLRDILTSEVTKEVRDGVMGSVVGAISAMATTYLIEYLIHRKTFDELISVELANHCVKHIKL